VRATAWFFIVAAVIVPLAVAWGLGARAQSESDSKGKKACLSLVKTLGGGTNFVSKKRFQQWTLMTWNDATCWYDDKGRVRIANTDVALQRTAIREPKLTTNQQVLQVARATMKNLGLKYREPLEVAPYGPGPVSGILYAPASTFGIKTYGVLGGYTISVDILGGKVYQIAWSPELVPTRPVVRVSKQRALSIALREFEKRQDPKRRYSIGANLNYYWPFRERVIPYGTHFERKAAITVTPAGSEYFSKGRVPYCWIVAQYPVNVEGMARFDQFSGGSLIIVDALTGDVLLTQN
jgi:hypothetical protein